MAKWMIYGEQDTVIIVLNSDTERTATVDVTTTCTCSGLGRGDVDALVVGILIGGGLLLSTCWMVNHHRCVVCPCLSECDSNVANALPAANVARVTVQAVPDRVPDNVEFGSVPTLIIPANTNEVKNNTIMTSPTLVDEA